MIAQPQDTMELLVQQLREGQAGAADRLLQRAYLQLQRLTRLMLRDFPTVRRWEETDDVWQTAVVRFRQALAETEPASPRHFFRLAGRYIRRTLIELARKHNGAQGLNPNIEASGNVPPAHRQTAAPFATVPDTNCPLKLAQWSEFHRQVDLLPEAEREVIDLLWYGELSQAEAAACLDISVRTVKRRWRTARLRLAAELEREGWL